MARKPPTKTQRKKHVKADAFINTLTGIGDASRDKRFGGLPQRAILNQADVEELYRGDDLAAVVVEKLVEEMFRKGFSVEIEGDKEQAEAVCTFLDDLGASAALKQAMIWSRQYGGGAVLLGADEGFNTNLALPLVPEKVKALRFLTALHRYELVPETWYFDPAAPKYGMPESYRLTPQVLPTDGAQVIGAVVHESRLLIFDGVPVSRRARQENLGWGDSVYIRVFEVLRDFNLTWGAAANLLSDFAQAVYKIAGLNEMLAAGDPEVVTERLRMLDLMRSVARAIVLDAGDGTKEGAPAEDFDRKLSSLAGLPEMLQQFAYRLAAAARMPVSILMGQSPAGLNATGEGDAEWFDDQVAAKQVELLQPNLKRLVRLAMLAKDGPTKGQEPDNWSIRFHPLQQLSDLEESQRRYAVAQADQIYIATQVVTPEEVAATRFGGDDYDGGALKVDMEARAAMAVTPEDRLAPAPQPDPNAPPPAKAKP